MANPKKRRTKSAVGKNRAHLALTAKTLNKCPKCGLAVQPHSACKFCGTYKGKAVLKVATKTTKAKKK
ncbi:50S ribosomal protein L32 [Candidatus Falkowbacteria bacterium CG10_big_fil_rev_8_21_14_0_10_39_9]|uniref:Large ribosomal subunit protein bL32 n=1 Tax=Candidatus Falkowbacteria bacterium CG10_big_fil_rev_8_21_14_0_10_39_9 TaxID=1974566 RepID=A0A2M6WR91_9BACT|nr:MAG: 50S ribosomal protein L32 [Candidatus Falkowbacteria bacterium CG10_big_fil_rev_8_21_14_0_10_39_9]